MSSIFGGSKNNSSNQAYPFLQSQLGGNIGAGNNAFSTMSALLGLGGNSGAANAAYNNYLNSSGYHSMLDTGSRAITGNAAARGLLNSGAVGKALTNYGQQLGSQYFNNYLGQLGNVFQGGLNSAQIIGGAGQQSSGSSDTGVIPALFG